MLCVLQVCLGAGVYPTMRATCEVVGDLTNWPPDDQNMCHFFQKSMVTRKVKWYTMYHSRTTEYKLTFGINEAMEPNFQGGFVYFALCLDENANQIKSCSKTHSSLSGVAYTTQGNQMDILDFETDNAALLKSSGTDTFIYRIELTMQFESQTSHSQTGMLMPVSQTGMLMLALGTGSENYGSIANFGANSIIESCHANSNSAVQYGASHCSIPNAYHFEKIHYAFSNNLPLIDGVDSNKMSAADDYLQSVHYRGYEYVVETLASPDSEEAYSSYYGRHFHQNFLLQPNYLPFWTIVPQNADNSIDADVKTVLRSFEFNTTCVVLGNAQAYSYWHTKNPRIPVLQDGFYQFVSNEYADGSNLTAGESCNFGPDSNFGPDPAAEQLSWMTSKFANLYPEIDHRIHPQWAILPKLYRRGCQNARQYFATNPTTPEMYPYIMDRYAYCRECGQDNSQSIDLEIFFEHRHSEWGFEQGDCSCPRDFEMNEEGNCVPCDNLKIKPPIGNSDMKCMHCKLGQFVQNGLECKDCPNGKYGNNLFQCVNCANGKYSSLSGQVACDACHACPSDYFRTNCTSERGGGRCVRCNHESCGNNEMIAGCLNTEGHNDAKGFCKPRELLQPTAQCPRRVSVETFDRVDENAARLVTDVVGGHVETQFGLGGFTFEEVFNAGMNDVAFACSRVCDGLTLGLENVDGVVEYGTSNSIFCDGPFACNVQSCTMVSALGESRLPRGCPVEIEAWNQSEYDAASVEKKEEIVDRFQDARGASCQECGSCSGRGCAKECTNLICDPGTIFDFSAEDTAWKLRCKQCEELENIKLCPTDFVTAQLPAAGEISMLQPMFYFSGCTPKTDERIATYGQCKHCDVLAMHEEICATGDFQIGCDDNGQTARCAECAERAGSRAQTVSYEAYSSTTQPMYCQVLPCEEYFTGVADNGDVCVESCGVACPDEFMELPCVLPHAIRCVEFYPLIADPQRTQGRRVTSTRWNLLETGKSLAFSSFENALITLRSVSDNLHVCVWGARNVLDGKGNAGTVSAVFYERECEHDEPTVSDHALPFLPLQNVVRDEEDRLDVLLNAPTSVRRYTGVTENGYKDDYAKEGIWRPLTGRAQVGDFFADVRVLSPHSDVLVPLRGAVFSASMPVLFSVWVRTSPGSAADAHTTALLMSGQQAGGMQILSNRFTHNYGIDLSLIQIGVDVSSRSPGLDTPLPCSEASSVLKKMQNNSGDMSRQWVSMQAIDRQYDCAGLQSCYWWRRSQMGTADFKEPLFDFGQTTWPEVRMAAKVVKRASRASDSINDTVVFIGHDETSIFSIHLRNEGFVTSKLVSIQGLKIDSTAPGYSLTGSSILPQTLIADIAYTHNSVWWVGSIGTSSELYCSTISQTTTNNPAIAWRDALVADDIMALAGDDTSLLALMCADELQLQVFSTVACNEQPQLTVTAIFPHDQGSVSIASGPLSDAGCNRRDYWRGVMHLNLVHAFAGGALVLIPGHTEGVNYEYTLGNLQTAVYLLDADNTLHGVAGSPTLDYGGLISYASSARNVIVADLTRVYVVDIHTRQARVLSGVRVSLPFVQFNLAMIVLDLDSYSHKTPSRLSSQSLFVVKTSRMLVFGAQIYTPHQHEYFLTTLSENTNTKFQCYPHYKIGNAVLAVQQDGETVEMVDTTPGPQVNQGALLLNNILRFGTMHDLPWEAVVKLDIALLPSIADMQFRVLQCDPHNPILTIKIDTNIRKDVASCFQSVLLQFRDSRVSIVHLEYEDIAQREIFTYTSVSTHSNRRVQMFENAALMSVTSYPMLWADRVSNPGQDQPSSTLSPKWRQLRHALSNDERRNASHLGVRMTADTDTGSVGVLVDNVQAVPLLTKKTIIFKCPMVRLKNGTIVSNSAYEMDEECNFICINECDAGHYRESTNCTCVPCPGGTHSNAQKTECLKCPAGKYSGVQAPECTSCAAGKYSRMSATGCLDCEVGKYSNLTAASQCLNCSVDESSDIAGIECWCIPGTYRNTSNICDSCEAGKFSNRAASECSDCHAGKYSGSKASECANCEQGKYSLLRATKCTPVSCAPGTYPNSVTSNSCWCCPRNTYRKASGTSSTTCQTCTDFRWLYGVAPRYLDGYLGFCPACTGATKCVFEDPSRECRVIGQ